MHGTLRQIRRVLGDPRVIWTMALLAAIHLIYATATAGDRPDAVSFMQAGQQWLHDPSHLYDHVAAYIARNHIGPVEGLIAPPFGAVVGAPFSLLRSPWDVISWVVADCLALVGALALLDRALHPSGVARAWLWLVALYFPPVLAEVTAGQISGFILLLGCLSIVQMARRPLLAGALTGLASGIKLYPIAIALGVGLRRLARFSQGLTVGLLAVVLIGFGPMGMSSAVGYVRDVLIPVLNTPYPDCQIVSISTLWARLVGGTAYPVIDGGQIIWHQVGPQLPWLASGLTLATLAAVIIGAVVAAWRSGWHPLYAPSVTFALGGLIPGELRTYQILPLLPLLLVVLVNAIQRRQRGTLTALAVGLVGLIEQPCGLLFPNLWTVALLWLFAVCCLQAEQFRSPSLSRSPRPEDATP